MLLVIFGAGASYDSVLHFPPPAPPSGSQNNCSPVIVPARAPVEDFRPPLANQLFDNRELFVAVMNNYPACKPLVNLLRGDIQVERQLAKFEQESGTYPLRRQQLAAIQYYLHHMLWDCQVRWLRHHQGITNYATLLDALERWRHDHGERICFVTFNYDTILEESITELWKYKFDSLESYTAHPAFRVIKLHGSIDWGLHLQDRLPPLTKPAEIIESATRGIESLGTYGKVSVPARFPDGTLGFPALAIPVEKKSEFSCPEDHRRALAEVIPNVTKIITIGWRATEQHFLNMLKARLTGLKAGVDLMVVSGDLKGATETNSNLGIAMPGPDRRYPTVPPGFSGLIREIKQLEDFLW
jgi:hypothetical protein